MANEKRIIEAYTLAEEIESLNITVAGKPARWNDAKHSVLRIIAEQPDVDAVEVPDKQLLKAIKLLIKQYEHSKQSDYVHNPIAHAFYHTWKQLDESGYGERRSDV